MERFHRVESFKELEEGQFPIKVLVKSQHNMFCLEPSPDFSFYKAFESIPSYGSFFADFLEDVVQWHSHFLSKCLDFSLKTEFSVKDPQERVLHFEQHIKSPFPLTGLYFECRVLPRQDPTSQITVLKSP